MAQAISASLSQTRLSNFVLGAVACNAFPNELFGGIVDCAEDSELYTLSHVNRCFRHRALPRIFERVQIVAGLRCILWKELKQDGNIVYEKRLLPDTFSNAVRAFRKDIKPELFRYTTKLTVRGLNAKERALADNNGGSGEDPYLTMCTLRGLLSLFPNVTNLEVSNVVWARCLEMIVDLSHDCYVDSDKRTFSTVSFSHIMHNRVVDSVFDVLELATTCSILSIDSVRWENSIPVPLFAPRQVRSDIRTLRLSLSDNFNANRQLARKYPILANLHHLELRTVSDLTMDSIYDLVETNKKTLETFLIDVGKNIFPIDDWMELPLFMCEKLQDVHLILELCMHRPHTSCAGSRTLTSFADSLPDTIRRIHLRVLENTLTIHAYRPLSTTPDWQSLLAALKTLDDLQVLQMSISQIYPNDQIEGYMQEWLEWIGGELTGTKIVLSDASFEDNEFVQDHLDVPLHLIARPTFTLHSVACYMDSTLKTRTREIQARLQIANRIRSILRNGIHAQDPANLDLDDLPLYTLSPVETGIVEVATMRKGDRKIDVIRNQSASAVFAITRFWSTLQMNFISANGFCCAYPSPTSQRVGIINPLALTLEGQPRSFIGPLVRKYSQRGYAFHNHWHMYIGHGCRDNHTHILCPMKRRSFEDQFAFYGEFGTATQMPRFDSVRGASVSDWKVGWRLGGFHEVDGFRALSPARVWHGVTGEVDRRDRYARMVEIYFLVSCVLKMLSAHAEAHWQAPSSQAILREI
ncbi:hypothetical protein NM688_g4693 [Phlebia brevispora]|uniref:Uncharacterized protein n=1 Tax=Phlebia brevispora TaxID=194682 RepID=A0ACC1T2H6_9APHY|nr:hypothetical protein NM688_g4693 [Phlebia brevispora]